MSECDYPLNGFFIQEEGVWSAKISLSTTFFSQLTSEIESLGLDEKHSKEKLTPRRLKWGKSLMLLSQPTEEDTSLL